MAGFVRVDRDALLDWLETRLTWDRGNRCPRPQAVLECQSRIELGQRLPPIRDLARKWSRSRDWVTSVIRSAHEAQRRVNETSRSPKSIGHPSATHRPPIGHPSATHRPGNSHPSATLRPGNGHPSATTPLVNQEVSMGNRPPIGHLSATEQPPIGQETATHRPPIGHLSATHRPPFGHSNIESRSLDLNSLSPLTPGGEGLGTRGGYADPKRLSAFWNTFPELPRGAAIGLMASWPIEVLELGQELAEKAAEAYITGCLKGSDAFKPSPVSYTQFIRYAGEIAQWAQNPDITEPQMGRQRRPYTRGGPRRGSHRPQRPEGGSSEVGTSQEEAQEKGPALPGVPLREWLAEQGHGPEGSPISPSASPAEENRHE